MTNKPARHTFFAGFVQVANLPQFYSNRVELSFLLRYNSSIFGPSVRVFIRYPKSSAEALQQNADFVVERGVKPVLELFAHNRAAYDAAAKLLASVGKAAVIHPTGTGKSFIAFQLVADHPGENILWLSPSEYIFATQRESLRRQAPKVSLAHVHFYTYAKLLRLTEEDLAAIADLHPVYIILDEYHRAGAQEWSAALQKLLAACPQAKLLGLSATNIRYLDNQRNMADELFDGNVASEMTLGEAIVRGILPAPKYVTTVFRYGRDLAPLRAARGQPARARFAGRER